jgi:hypothetical protein
MPPVLRAARRALFNRSGTRLNIVAAITTRKGADRTGLKQ